MGFIQTVYLYISKPAFIIFSTNYVKKFQKRTANLDIGESGEDRVAQDCAGAYAIYKF